MPPPPGSAVQTPEPKRSIAGVFKSLTSGKGNKSATSSPLSSSSIPATAAQLAQRLHGPDTPGGVVYGGPSGFEELYERVKPEKPLPERIAAAEALRVAVTDYPLSGVSSAS